jgi:hypothetical protein
MFHSVDTISLRCEYCGLYWASLFVFGVVVRLSCVHQDTVSDPLIWRVLIRGYVLRNTKCRAPSKSGSLLLFTAIKPCSPNGNVKALVL